MNVCVVNICIVVDVCVVNICIVVVVDVCVVIF